MTFGNPLLGYVRWQAQDALPRALTPVLLFLLMAGLPLWSASTQFGLAAMDRPGDAQRDALQIYAAILPIAMTLGAVILASGLPATDREKQYFRFLFAKPVSVWQFYLQQFTVAVAMFVAAMALVPLGFSAIVTAVSVVAVIKSAFVYALLFGSLLTLCGSLVNKDGVALVGVAAISSILQGLAQGEGAPAWIGFLAHVLPPFRTADLVRSLWISGQPVNPADVALVIGYSLGMLAAALVLVRRLPLARS